MAASFGVLLVDSNRGIGLAFVPDQVPESSLGKCLVIFNSMPWFAGILRFALSGHAFEALGMTATFIIGAFLPFTAIFLLLLIRKADA